MARRPTGTTRGAEIGESMVPLDVSRGLQLGLVAVRPERPLGDCRAWFECGCCVDCCAWTHTDRRRWLVPAVRVARCVEHEPLLNQFD